MAKKEKSGADGVKEEKKYREVYLYDQRTGVYIGPQDATEGDPEGVLFTEKKPPHVGEMDQMVVFRNGDWETVKSASMDDILNALTKRDRLLASSDWTQLEDSPVDKNTWAEYRQLLRDVPAQAGYPGEIEWPETPKFEKKATEEKVK